MNAAIKVENLSKRYQIGKQLKKNLNFQEQLTDLVAGPFKRIKRALKGEHLSDTEDFWALNDVSFEVQHGEVIGIIGRNGAGKSTLLKILSRITKPTSGRVVINGRVASLLEVGTGFHPELTGRENIYLNGSILGMTRVEINKKFDEIVEFSEIEKFLDTPVKRYSSGMYVRLAFAVAAHLDPEILIVDEVLAVGDVAFQKKCLGKMQDVSKGGRTVLFVSHNVVAIKSLCQIAMQLQNGRSVNFGSAQEVAETYEQSTLNSYSREGLPPGVIYCKQEINSENFDVYEVCITDNSGEPIRQVRTFDSIKVRIKFYSPKVQKNGSAVIFFQSITGVTVLRCATMPDSSFDFDFKQGENEVLCNIRLIPMPAGTYIFGFGLAIPKQQWLFLQKDLCTIDISTKDIHGSGFPPLEIHASAVCEYSWEVTR